MGSAFARGRRDRIAAAEMELALAEEAEDRVGAGRLLAELLDLNRERVAEGCHGRQ